MLQNEEKIIDMLQNVEYSNLYEMLRFEECK